MKRLLGDLCLDLENQYADVAKSLALPVAYFRFLGQALECDAYAHWKVAGWIEALNDLVSLHRSAATNSSEQNPREFALQLFAECEGEVLREQLSGRPVSTRVLAGLVDSNGDSTNSAPASREELTQESLCSRAGTSDVVVCFSQDSVLDHRGTSLPHDVERAETAGNGWLLWM